MMITQHSFPGFWISHVELSLYVGSWWVKSQMHFCDAVLPMLLNASSPWQRHVRVVALCVLATKKRRLLGFAVLFR